MVETSGLTKEFKEGAVCAVKDVNIKIEKGEIFCLVGPNGAGKTTLLKMLCGLVIPTSGSAKIKGHDVIKDIGNIKSLIGASAFAENSFFSELTVEENLKFFAALYNLDHFNTKIKINHISELLGIGHEMKLLFQNLSSGAKQKLSIARCLLNSPELLLLDEPMKSVDAKTAARLLEYLKEIACKQRKTIFYITHNPQEVERLSSRVSVMDNGEIR